MRSAAHLPVILAALIVLVVPSALAQGPLSPGGAPAPSMKTLQQVEARTPIDAVNTPGGGSSVFEITQSGSYYLTANLDVPAGKTKGIRIEEGVRGGVTIDLNGFTIAGASEAAIEVGPSVAGVVIRNGHIRDGAKHAILAEEASEMTFEDLVVVNCGAGTNFETIFGANRTVLRNVQVRDCGLGIQAGTNSEVVGCTVENAGDHGISVASNSRVESCAVHNAGGRGIDLGSRCLVKNNNLSDGDAMGTGIGSGGSQNVVDGNRVSGFALGLQFTGDRNRINGNTVKGNTDNYEFGAGNELHLLLSEIPESIDWSATVVLTKSLQLSELDSAGITVSGSDVTIDLAGFSLVGPGKAAGSLGAGIVLPFPQIAVVETLVVRNGSIRGWRVEGIYSTAKTGRFLDLQVADCGGVGIRANFPGNNWAERCRVEKCEVGILFSGGIVKDSSVEACGGTGIGAFGDGAVVERCTARSNDGVGIALARDCIVRSCTAISNLGGIETSGGALVKDCTASRNDQFGIKVVQDSLVKGNVCSFNRDGESGAGILVVRPAAGQAGGGVRIEDNVCNENWTGIEFTGASGAVIIRNSAAYNDTNYLGFTASPFFGPETNAISTHPWANLSIP